MIGRRALTRKVLRDLWHLRSQMVATAIVMACGVAMFVTLRSMHDWLIETQDAYYEQFRFADVFAGLRHAPLGVADTLARIPGVAMVEPRVVRDVSVELPGLAEPGTARLVGIPAPERPMLNGVYLREGRWPSASGNEVLVSVSLATANGFRPGDSLAAVINGRWQRLRISGTALSPEYVYETPSSPTHADRRGSVIFFPNRTRSCDCHGTSSSNRRNISSACGFSSHDTNKSAEPSWGKTSRQSLLPVWPRSSRIQSRE